MTHKLVLELPGEVYEPLLDTASRARVTPEEIVIDWLAAVSRHAARDPIEPFIGAFRSDVPDWTDRHTDYLGRALKEQLRDRTKGGEGCEAIEVLTPGRATP